jgi:hypothetical protein
MANLLLEIKEYNSLGGDGVAGEEQVLVQQAQPVVNGLGLRGLASAACRHHLPHVSAANAASAAHVAAAAAAACDTRRSAEPRREAATQERVQCGVLGVSTAEAALQLTR